MPQQVGEPLAVPHVGLAPRHGLDVAGVDQQQLELLLQQVPDRLPVDPGALHRHVGHPCAASQSASARMSGVIVPKVRIVLLGVPSGPVSPRRRRPPLVHVQPTAARIDDLHGRSSCGDERPSGVLAIAESGLRASPRERQSVVPRSTRVQLLIGLAAPGRADLSTLAPSMSSVAPTRTVFIPRSWPAGP